MSIDWIAFALGFAGTMTVLALVTWVASVIRKQEAFDHDFTTIDETELAGAIEGNLRMILPHYVHVELNRAHHKEAA